MIWAGPEVHMRQILQHTRVFLQSVNNMLLLSEQFK
jgi:hypothetical protein